MNTDVLNPLPRRISDSPITEDIKFVRVRCRTQSNTNAHSGGVGQEQSSRSLSIPNIRFITNFDFAHSTRIDKQISKSYLKIWTKPDDVGRICVGNEVTTDCVSARSQIIAPPNLKKYNNYEREEKKGQENLLLIHAVIRGGILIARVFVASEQHQEANG